MRLFWVGAIAVLVSHVAVAANATTTTSTPAATRICLGAAGATFDYDHEPFTTYREEMNQLQWVVGHDRLGDPVDINIYWTLNRASPHASKDNSLGSAPNSGFRRVKSSP